MNELRLLVDKSPDGPAVRPDDTTGGDATWFGQAAVSYYGSDAAQSGDVADSQETWLQTTIEGTGTLDLWLENRVRPQCPFLSKLETRLGRRVRALPVGRPRKNDDKDGREK
jgi:hypothetical protein